MPKIPEFEFIDKKKEAVVFRFGSRTAILKIIGGLLWVLALSFWPDKETANAL